MKGLQRSMRRAPAQRALVRKQKVSVRNVPLTVAGVTGVGFGFAVLADLPEGNILFLGAVSYLQFRTASADVTTTFDGDYAIGTVGTVNANVTDAGEANIIPSTALGAATAKLSPMVKGVNSSALTGVVIDNTNNDLGVTLNLLIDDAAISGNAPFTVEGHVILSYVVLGDD